MVCRRAPETSLWLRSHWLGGCFSKSPFSSEMSPLTVGSCSSGWPCTQACMSRANWTRWVKEEGMTLGGRSDGGVWEELEEWSAGWIWSMCMYEWNQQRLYTIKLSPYIPYLIKLSSNLLWWAEENYLPVIFFFGVEVLITLFLVDI